MGIGRDELLKPLTRTFHVVETSRGPVRLRSVTERERARFEADTLDKSGKVTRKGLVTMKPRLIILCAVNDDGDPLLSNNDIDDLLEMDSATINQLADVCQQLVGITENDIEDLEKNYERAPGDDSHTG
tara:strand:+ start:9701 stop:10087 length:387 start_codon:yes stop_codon:yes gene_type:complete